MRTTNSRRGSRRGRPGRNRLKERESQEMDYKQVATEILDEMAKAGAMVIAAGGEHRPMLILITDQSRPPGRTLGPMVMFENPSDAETDREAYYETLARTLLKNPQVIGYFMVAEGWLVEVPKGTKLTKRPSLHPNRIETLNLDVQFRAGYHRTRIYNILRPADGQNVGSKIELRLEIDNKKETRGVLMDLFRYLTPRWKRYPNPTYDEIGK